MSLFSNLFGGKKKGEKEILECEEQLQRRPDDPALLKRLGDLYLKNNESESAAEIYVRLGDIYNARGFYPKAIALYKQAQKINASWEKPLEKLAELYQVQGFAREAATQYVKLSELMELIGDSEQAIVYMQKAAGLDPAHRELTEQVSAYDVRETAMHETVPGQGGKPQFLQSDFFNLNKELEEEIEELNIDEGAVTQDMEDSTGVDSVFKALEEHATQEGTDDPLFHYNMGLAYRETGLFEEAADSFQRVIATGQKLFDAHVMLGISFRDLGMFAESLQALKEAASLSEVNEDQKVGILYEIAQTYKARGDTDKALNLFREIQSEHRDFKDVELEIIRLAGGG